MLKLVLLYVWFSSPDYVHVFSKFWNLERARLYLSKINSSTIGTMRRTAITVIYLQMLCLLVFFFLRRVASLAGVSAWLLWRVTLLAGVSALPLQRVTLLDGVLAWLLQRVALLAGVSAWLLRRFTLLVGLLGLLSCLASWQVVLLLFQFLQIN